MARRTFAVADEALAGLAGAPAAGQVLTVWTDRAAGQQVSALFNLADQPIDELRTDARGRFPFRADTDAGVLWVRHADGSVWMCVAVEAAELAAIAGAAYPVMSQQVTRAVGDAASASQRSGAAQQAAAGAVAAATEALANSAVGARTMSTPSVLTNVNTYDSWPYLAAEADGTLWLIHSSGTGHLPPGNRRATTRKSVDGGRTWPVDRSYGAAGENHGAAGVAVAANGDLIVITDRATDVTQQDARADYRVHRKPKGSNVWTLIQTYPWTQIMQTGQLLLLQSGVILGTWYGQNYRWGIIRSVDNGATWTIQDVVASGASALPGEAKMVQAPDGTIILAGRSGSTTVNQWTSADDGTTWTAPRPTSLSWLNITLAMIISQGRAVVLWMDRQTGILYTTSADPTDLITDPAAWEPSRAIARAFGSEGGIHDRGYPALVALPNGDLLAAWYAGWNRTQIITGVLTRGAAALDLANRRAVTDVMPYTLPSDFTTTDRSTTAGAWAKGVLVPFMELGQKGEVCVRLVAQVKNSVAGAVTRVGMQMPNGTVHAVEVVCVNAGAEYLVDTGWIVVPRDQLTAGSWETGSVHRVVVRLASPPSTATGTATLGAASTLYVGVRR